MGKSNLAMVFVRIVYALLLGIRRWKVRRRTMAQRMAKVLQDALDSVSFRISIPLAPICYLPFMGKGNLHQIFRRCANRPWAAAGISPRSEKT